MNEQIKEQLEYLYRRSKQDLRNGIFTEQEALCVCLGYIVCLGTNNLISNDDVVLVSAEFTKRKYDRW